MSDERLLPCPFCGGEVEIRYFFRKNPVSISCKNKNCVWSRMAFCCETEEQAIEGWNRRAHDK